MKYATVHMLIINESKYIDGACISAHTYRKFGSKDIEHIVMVDKSIKNIKKLQIFFDKIIQIEPIFVNSNFQLSSEARVERYSKWIDYAITKWSCLMLKDYKKVLLVDIDTLANKDYTHIFELQAPAWSILNMSAIREEQKIPFFRKNSKTGKKLNDILKEYTPKNSCERNFDNLPVNASIVLLKPSITDFKNMMKMINKNIKENGYYKLITSGSEPNGPDESVLYEFYHCNKQVPITILGTEFLTDEHRKIIKHPVYVDVESIISSYSSTEKPWLKPDNKFWPDELPWKKYRKELKLLM
jgi:hypothetical protein